MPSFTLKTHLQQMLFMVGRRVEVAENQHWDAYGLSKERRYIKAAGR